MVGGDRNHEWKGGGASTILFTRPWTCHGTHHVLGVSFVERVNQDTKGEIFSEQVHAGAEEQEEGVED